MYLLFNIKNNLYLWNRIVGSHAPMKVETRTPFPILYVLDNIKTGTMKTINLTQGQVALVDDEDYEYLAQFKWNAHKSGVTYYAERHAPVDGKQYYVKMHREIMNTPKGMEVDHIDHNGLNCQKSNMRNCTHKQNMTNQRPRGKSKYRGVSWSERMGKWHGYISNPPTHLGYFDSEEETARRYDKFAKIRFGEFANLNFPNKI